MKITPRLLTVLKSLPSPKFPASVKIVEVSPRDGLQNQKEIVPTDDKVELIQNLAKSGLQTVQTTSFVSPKWVPQMADSSDVFKRVIQWKKEEEIKVDLPALVPNLRGLKSAVEAGVEEIAVFGAASQSFSQKNINCSIKESLDRFEAVAKEAISLGIRVRGYVSCVMGCPYEGKVAPEKVNEVASRLFEMGCYQVSLGDTIGIGTPEQTALLLDAMSMPTSKLAAHFHNTYDRALQNLVVALSVSFIMTAQRGISVVDSSVAGLGGCPYAKGASGNVATQDVLSLLKLLNIESGVDAKRIFETGAWISEKMKRESQAHVKKFEEYESLSKIV